MLPKILSAKEVREWDKFTLTHAGMTSIELMEKAANAFCQQFTQQFSIDTPIAILCGKGNNGGDGYAIARLLLKQGYAISVFAETTENLSTDTAINLAKIRAQHVQIRPLLLDVKLIPSNAVIIDALLGSGVNRLLAGNLLAIVKHINSLRQIIVSVDIPSGLHSDTPQIGEAIRANYTICFEVPKKSFLFSENFPFVGEWITVPIGLSSAYLPKKNEHWLLIDPDFIQSTTLKRSKFDHKGTYGHALIIAGSTGKFGALVLASKAALKTGCGLVSVLSTYSIGDWFHGTFPEAMILSTHDFSKNFPVKINAIGIGPAMGTDTEAKKLLTQAFSLNRPLVIDADALTMLSENKELINQIPPQSILTPHPKELERLCGKFDNWEKKIEFLQTWCARHTLILVLKGAHTFVITPEKEVYVNNTGNNGMATAGSGDVLTGIITSLLAQGYGSITAAIRGVYLHGVAGDLAVENQGQLACIASSINDYLGLAQKQ
ncbi:MAG: hydroxyethylthiazole kinase-like uncharacterized protein yjeF [Flavobacteriales bacterium]|jgi:hydroxyethylthiazole kinase-like uncharacterized protein yjeF